jgi:predicted kinase
MRPFKDYRTDHIVKQEMLDGLRARGFEPFLIFDDRQQVVDMWRRNGLFVLQCDPRPSHTNHDSHNFHESIKWPLTVLVGPSGAGKTTWIQEYKDEYPSNVISSDDIRQMLCGDFADQSKNDKVFEAMHEIAHTKLKHGLPVTLDATHLKNADRIKAAKLVAPEIPVRYVVLNRTLEEKKRDGGWRNGVSVKGKTLIEHHDQVFKSNIKAILCGDELPNVTVFDLRKNK